MALKIYTSYATQALLEQLADNLRSGNGKSFSLLNRPLIMVANSNLEKWLYLELSKKWGIAANLDITYLEMGLDRLLGHRLDKDRMSVIQLEIFKLLKDSDNNEMRDFFGRLLFDEERGFSDRAAWLLAFELGTLFREYEYALDIQKEDNWENLPCFAMVDAQKKIYQRLKKQLGAAYLFIPLDIEPGTLKSAGATLHLFGFSNFSRTHGGLLKKLARELDLFVYHLEFHNQDHELIKFWGKAGFKSLAFLSGGENSSIFIRPREKEEGEPRSLLRSLQGHLAKKTAAQTLPAPDDSLIIFGSPGYYKEVESVYQSILANMHHKRELKLSDIAVLVSDIKVYTPYIRLVFDAREGSEKLPYNLNDTGASTMSVYAAGVRALLELAGGERSRRAFFVLFNNPFFQEAFGLSRERVEEWEQIVDELGIFHDEQVDSAGTHSWNWGLMRLMLGRIMESPQAESGQKEWEKHFGPYNPFEVKLGGFENSEELVFIVKDLVSRFKGMKKTKTLELWVEELADLFGAYLKVPVGLSGEEKVMRAVFQSLDRLEKERRSVSFDFFPAYLDKALEAITGGVGEYLTGGVTIASLLPMRPIPFKIIYVLGLSEGLFPGLESKSTLDLRNLLSFEEKEKLGILTSPEKNRYLFLETLFCAREKLYLSYNNKNLAKDQELFPSQVIQQLVLNLERQTAFSPEDGSASPRSFKIHQTPFNVFDLLSRPSEQQNKEKEWNFLPGRVFYGEPVLDDLYDPQGFFWDIRGRDVVEEEQVVNTRELAGFIKNPLRTKLGRRLGLYDEEVQDSTLEEAEPFYSSFPFGYQTYREGFFLSLDLKNFDFDEYYAYQQRLGRTPAQIFGELEKNKVKDKIHGRIQELFAASSPQPPLKSLILEETELTSDGAEETRGSLKIKGSLNGCWLEGQDLYCLLFAGKDYKPTYLVEAFVFYAVCLGLGPDLRGRLFYGGADLKERLEIFGPEKLIALVSSEKGVRRFHFQLDRQRAKNWLKVLLHYFLNEDYFALPFALLSEVLDELDFHHEDLAEYLEDWIMEKDEGFGPYSLSDLEKLFGVKVRGDLGDYLEQVLRVMMASLVEIGGAEEGGEREE